MMHYTHLTKPSGQRILLHIAIAALLTAGCDFDRTETKIDKLEILPGSNNQCAFSGAKFPNPVKIEAFGPARGLIPGSKGQRKPVPNATLIARVRGESDLKIEQNEQVTDSGGMVRFDVIAGKSLGDHYIDVYAKDFPDKKTSLRFITGLKIEGAKQEPSAGSVGDEPIRIKLLDSNSKPMAGIPVYFSVASAPNRDKETRILQPETVTDKDGVAETEFKIGKATGVYEYSVEISDPSRKLHIRKLDIREMGMNLPLFTIAVLGGLAIFIFGMRSMSDGLQMVAGERMKNVLQLFAKNRFIAVIAGALVTAVIQSSSATSVMVVGFVNAGLLNLFQSIGIIFGANIGTTITAQMIAFKLDELALPAIILGLLISLLGRKRITKGWGQAILGFGFLFYGMTIMGHELKVIKDFPSFINFFRHFDCSPVNGVMPIKSVLGAVAIGTFMTVLIQSSSATIAIALALAASGMINFYTAVPLILGDNIGTTITAVLASLAANKRAKQTAVAHVLFNLLGCLYMTGLFFVRMPGTSTPVFLAIIDKITPGNVFAEDPENIVRHIAMSHTMFNAFNVVLFLPLIGVIARLCNWIIPIRPQEPVKLNYLDPNLLTAPSVAIEQTIRSIRYMVKESWSMVRAAMEKNFLAGQYSKDHAAELAEREDKVDALQAEITTYLVQLTQRDLTEPQSELIPLLMHCTNDAERIADHTANIMKLSERLATSALNFSPNAAKEIAELWQTLGDEATSVISAINNTDNTNIHVALKKENQIDILTDVFEKNHVERLKSGSCDAMAGIIFIEMLNNLEKIGDHLSNIAERTSDMQKHHINLD